MECGDAVIRATESEIPGSNSLADGANLWQVRSINVAVIHSAVRLSTTTATQT